MTLKSLVSLALVLGLWVAAPQLSAQTKERTVEAKGSGGARPDALDDALRNAIGQAVGVELKSETRVENFELISDAIATNVKGYVTGYDVLNEGPKDGFYEINVRARVSTASLKADAQWLARSVGGIRFMVVYNTKGLTPEEAKNMDFAVERINQYLASKRYRYIEKARFESLRREALNTLEAQNDTSETSYVQYLAAKADAQFVIMIKGYHTETKETGAFGTRQATELVMDVKTYDNCTAEGLGTVVLESGFKQLNGEAFNYRNAITDLVKGDMDKLMEVFNQYVGGWVNNGTPFELRFMGDLGFRELRDLRQQLQNDRAFGGQMEIVGAEGYQKLNLTYRKQPADLADQVLQFADNVPALKARRFDVSYIYGRQITFAPTLSRDTDPKTGTPKPAPKPGSGKKKKR